MHVPTGGKKRLCVDVLGGASGKSMYFIVWEFFRTGLLFFLKLFLSYNHTILFETFVP